MKIIGFLCHPVGPQSVVAIVADCPTVSPRLAVCPDSGSHTNDTQPNLKVPSPAAPEPKWQTERGLHRRKQNILSIIKIIQIISAKIEKIVSVCLCVEYIRITIEE